MFTVAGPPYRHKVGGVTAQWGVKWEALSPDFPEEIHLKPSRQSAEESLRSSMFPGVLVSREVSEWSEVK